MPHHSCSKPPHSCLQYLPTVHAQVMVRLMLLHAVIEKPAILRRRVLV
jgi:hypothetical protein